MPADAPRPSRRGVAVGVVLGAGLHVVGLWALARLRAEPVAPASVTVRVTVVAGTPDAGGDAPDADAGADTDRAAPASARSESESERPTRSDARSDARQSARPATPSSRGAAIADDAPDAAITAAARTAADANADAGVASAANADANAASPSGTATGDAGRAGAPGAPGTPGTPGDAEDAPPAGRLDAAAVAAACPRLELPPRLRGRDLFPRRYRVSVEAPASVPSGDRAPADAPWPLAAFAPTAAPLAFVDDALADLVRARCRFREPLLAGALPGAFAAGRPPRLTFLIEFY